MTDGGEEPRGATKGRPAAERRTDLRRRALARTASILLEKRLDRGGKSLAEMSNGGDGLHEYWSVKMILTVECKN